MEWWNDAMRTIESPDQAMQRSAHVDAVAWAWRMVASTQGGENKRGEDRQDRADSDRENIKDMTPFPCMSLVLSDFSGHRVLGAECTSDPVLI